MLVHEVAGIHEALRVGGLGIVPPPPPDPGFPLLPGGRT
jgi:hypothetical protein